MGQQGTWKRWANVLEWKMTWVEVWKAEPHQIKVLIPAVYDMLSSSSNLCSKCGTLEHILSCCPKALGEGRYKSWRSLQKQSTPELSRASGPAPQTGHHRPHSCVQPRPSARNLSTVVFRDLPTQGKKQKEETKIPVWEKHVRPYFTPTTSWSAPSYFIDPAQYELHQWL